MVPDVVSRVLATEKAHSIVLIPGGMGETAAGKEKELQVKDALNEARANNRFSPVIVGPNCLGIRSKPGRYDTLFIPQLKLPAPTGQVRDVALISQSGAFMITRMNRIPVLDPSYCISTGNQLDLTQVDFVEALVDDDQVRVIGLYVEGFRPLDARRLARLIARARTLGKDFVTYLTGRTPMGQTAAASHTASISGDYISTIAVLRQAGALVAETFDEFRHFLLLSGLMGSRVCSGHRIAAISNAGYESVGMADNLDDRHFRLSPLTEATVQRLADVLNRHRLATLVTPHNPLDLTPMATDAAVGECVSAIMEDDTVDAAVVGMVPLTVALKTLPPGIDPKNRDTITAADSFPQRMISVFRSTTKPMVFVIDAGTLYDPLARCLEEAGLPTFRSADVAMIALQRFLRYRQRCGRP
jgi:acyl-CoA synthetase (NDP forming)